MALSEKQMVMIGKIQKLLELGKDGNGAFSPEAESANRLAAKLMAENAIDFIDLRQGKKPNCSFEQFDMAMEGTKVDWESYLANVIAKAFDVKVIQSTYDGWKLMYCGVKTDIEISVFFFKYLRRSVGMLSSHSFKRKPDQQNFAYGMVEVIGQRLKKLQDMRNEAIQSMSDCRALMVVKTDGLDKFVKEQFPRLRMLPGTRLKGSAQASAAGREAGHKVNLSRPIGHTGAAGAAKHLA